MKNHEIEFYEKRPLKIFSNHSKKDAGYFF
jgi:hypothetical protein